MIWPRRQRSRSAGRDPEMSLLGSKLLLAAVTQVSAWSSGMCGKANGSKGAGRSVGHTDIASVLAGVLGVAA